MSEISNEILFGESMTPPEMDNYTEDEDRRTLKAIYESSSLDILEQMNLDTFRNTYKILIDDITSRSLKKQKIFIDRYLDKMFEVYEFEFEKNLIYKTQTEIDNMFKFIEFVEFDNLSFLKYVWRYLDDILSVNIRTYVISESDSIIKEITHQSNILDLTENVSEFLRTYNKEGIIEWFKNRSERQKYEIYSENLE